MRISSSPYLFTETLLRKHLMFFKQDVKGVTVDFGSGDFRLTKDFLDRPSEMYAIDNWTAADYHLKVPKNVKFYFATVEKSPFAQNAFDTVICTEVLEHVDDPDKLLSECNRVLKPGGTLLVTIPFNFFVHGAPNDFRRYTIFGLQKLLAKHGLHINKYVLVGGIWTTTINNLITYFGFRKSNKIFRIITKLFLVAANAFALTFLNRTNAVKEGITPEENDRKNPISIIVTAINQKQNGEIPKEKVVCPKCHSHLIFDNNIICSNCGSTFKRIHNIPALADESEIHNVNEGME